MRLGELARDGEAEAGAFDAAARLGAAAEEGVEDRVALLRRHAGPGIDHVDHRLRARLAAGARGDRDGAAAGVNLTALPSRLSRIERSFSGSASTVDLVQVERQRLRLGAHRQLVRARHLAHQRVERDRPRLERSRGVQRALVVEQVLDQPLQLDAVVAHDGDHLALRRRERPADLVVEQLRALAQRGERRLQLVGQVAQEAVLLRLELGQPAAQPVEALAERLQVLGAAHA